jgi:uncharacterized protein YbaP (TraB family)
VAATLAAAAPAHAEAPVPQCHGTDMLPELQQKSPELYAQVVAESRKVPNAEAVLWKIEKPDLAPSYLLGTMHLSDPRVTVLSQKTKEAIAQSKSVALEVADLSQQAMTTAMADARDLIVYSDGKSLKQELSADEYAKAKEVVSKSGMPAEFAATLKPWLVGMLLATSDCERKQRAAGAMILDRRVAAEAKKDGVTVTGLETIEGQLKALASIPEDQQIAMLKVGLKYLDRDDDLIETLVQMYLKRNIGAAMPFQIALAEEAGTPASAFDGFTRKILVERNARMLTAAMPMIDEGNAFIAVGALHLVGEKGLVERLRERGFTVTPVE